jgi:hypothetical protein
VRIATPLKIPVVFIQNYFGRSLNFIRRKGILDPRGYFKRGKPVILRMSKGSKITGLQSVFHQYASNAPRSGRAKLTSQRI